MFIDVSSQKCTFIENFRLNCAGFRKFRKTSDIDEKIVDGVTIDFPTFIKFHSNFKRIMISNHDHENVQLSLLSETTALTQNHVISKSRDIRKNLHNSRPHSSEYKRNTFMQLHEMPISGLEPVTPRVTGESVTN